MGIYVREEDFVYDRDMVERGAEEFFTLALETGYLYEETAHTKWGITDFVNTYNIFDMEDPRTHFVSVMLSLSDGERQVLFEEYRNHNDIDVLFFDECEMHDIHTAVKTFSPVNEDA